MIERKIKKAVITGPTGALGSALCQELAECGIDVYAVCRPGTTRTDNLPKHPRVSCVYCGIDDLLALPDLIPGGADAFYHFAWTNTIGPGRNDMLAQVKNIQYTLDAVRVAKHLGCQVFIGSGSQAEYGRVNGAITPDTPCFPENGYGMAKLCAGQMSCLEAKKLGMDHVWVRILSLYGPCDGTSTMISSVIQQLMEGKKPALTEGVQKWDYLYSGDAACAMHLIAKYGVSGKVYPLGAGAAKPLKYYIQEIRDAIDPSLPLGFGEIPYGPLQVMHLEADISLLHQDTGFIPQITFEDGIRKTIEWIKRNSVMT